MPEQQTASGADLARQALANYRATAKTAPTANPRPRTTRRERGDGRDPVGLGAVLGRINTDQDWRLALTGGSILDQWPTLCPQFVDTVQPVSYDPERGRLDLRPASHAYAAHLRLLGGQLARQINDKLGKPAVRSIRVLPVGAIAAPATATMPDQHDQTPEPGPVITRETASPGYQRTLAEALAHKPARPADDPHIARARDDLNARIAHPTRREPQTAFTDAVAEQERLTAPEPADRLQASLAAARARAAQEQHGDVPKRLFGAA
ncbi:DUF721 domain-containing protein [Streptomyces sp. AcH 505]|uniref:DciA family protein n=1 Tax=Streptomyces sp. AcH 505 TaxID=352211 RepID=UPI0006946473